MPTVGHTLSVRHLRVGREGGLTSLDRRFVVPQVSQGEGVLKRIRSLRPLNNESRFDALPFAPRAVNVPGALDQARALQFRDAFAAGWKEAGLSGLDQRPMEWCEKLFDRMFGIGYAAFAQAARQLSCALSVFLGDDPFVLLVGAKDVADRYAFLSSKRSGYYMWQHCMQAGLRRMPVQRMSAAFPDYVPGISHEILLHHPRMKYVLLDDAGFTGTQVVGSLLALKRELGGELDGRVCVATAALSTRAWRRISLVAPQVQIYSAMKIPLLGEVFSDADMNIYKRLLGEARQLAPVATHYHLHDNHGQAANMLPYARALKNYTREHERHRVDFSALLDAEMQRVPDEELFARMMRERVRQFLGRDMLNMYDDMLDIPGIRLRSDNFRAGEETACLAGRGVHVPIYQDDVPRVLRLHADGLVQFEDVAA